MKILVLGGTQMLGRDFIELFSENNEIIIANRGITNNHLFKDINKLKINRNSSKECEILNQSTFDLTVDFSCYTLEQFKNTYQYINSKKYIYISTMSVFDKKVFLQPDPSSGYYNYCCNKIIIEDYIINNLKNILIVRPCAIYGENDYTNRFYKKNNNFYWRHDNSEVGEGAMHVKEFTLFLSNLIETEDFNSVKDIESYKNNVFAINSCFVPWI